MNTFFNNEFDKNVTDRYQKFIQQADTQRMVQASQDNTEQSTQFSAIATSTIPVITPVVAFVIDKIK